MAKGGRTYYDVLTDAVRDISEHGYDSADRIAYWSEQLRQAAERTMTPPHQMEEMLREAMLKIYQKLVDKGEIAKLHSGVARFTVEKLRPHLRAELDRRILASAGLIKANRKQAVDLTLKRFAGWATSIPAGGSETVDKVDEKAAIRKPLAKLSFEERRVMIDQGAKLNASINEIVARDGQAIAVRWHSNWRQPGYDYRPDHKALDGNIYLLKGNWAQAKGLVKAGPAGYYEDTPGFAVEPFCRCRGVWLYSLRALPDDMLTVKGAAELARVRAELAATS